LKKLHAVGNPLLHSDAQAAMHLARAAVLAAAANVRANLSFLHEEDRAEVGRQLEHAIARVTD
jgi:formiminotetrahydrofolate cyclodeaminase